MPGDDLCFHALVRNGLLGVRGRVSTFFVWPAPSVACQRTRHSPAPFSSASSMGYRRLPPHTLVGFCEKKSKLAFLLARCSLFLLSPPTGTNNPRGGGRQTQQQEHYKFPDVMLCPSYLQGCQGTSACSTDPVVSYLRVRPLAYALNFGKSGGELPGSPSRHLQD